MNSESSNVEYSVDVSSGSHFHNSNTSSLRQQARGQQVSSVASHTSRKATIYSLCADSKSVFMYQWSRLRRKSETLEKPIWRGTWRSPNWDRTARTPKCPRCHLSLPFNLYTTKLTVSLFDEICRYEVPGTSIHADPPWPTKWLPKRSYKI